MRAFAEKWAADCSLLVRNEDYYPGTKDRHEPEAPARGFPSLALRVRVTGCLPRSEQESSSIRIRWLVTLAAAEAECDNFKEAVHWQKKAMELGLDCEDSRATLKQYEAGKPYRDENAQGPRFRPSPSKP